MGRFRKLLPFLSLLVGIGSGLMMKRTPERAWLVATAAGASFLTLALFLLLARTDLERLDGRRRTLAKVSHYALAAGTQSMAQLNLFFSIPFYFWASSPFVGHGLYLAVLGAAGTITLWDPLFAWWVRSSLRGGVLQAIATFSGLNCVLPMQGISNRVSLYVAAGAAALLAPILELASTGQSRRARILRFAGFLLVPLALSLGASVLIPPAPLKLVESAIGTSIVDRGVVGAAANLPVAPSQLVCFTAIAAPRGLEDRLFHVWRHDRALVDSVELQIAGGRAEGYRTWSSKKNLGPKPSGVWTCQTETASGQRLGQAEVRIE